MKLPELAIDNHRFTIIIFLAFLILGIGATVNMPASEDPPIDVPGIDVVVFYSGTSALDMERLVAEPLEAAINEVEDIKRIKTKVEDGVVHLEVEFFPFVDSGEKFNRVREKINKVRSELPPDLTGIETVEWSPTENSILQFALVSDTYPHRDLYEEARYIKRVLERVAGVRRVDVHGSPAEEIHIDVDPQRLARSRLTVDQVVSAVRSYNATISGGKVYIGQRRFNVQTSGAYRSLEEIRRTVVKAEGGQLVYLQDVAQIDFGYQDHLYRTFYNGKSCLFITVHPQKNARIFQISNAIKQELPELKSRLPEGMALEIGFDQSVDVVKRIDNFLGSMAQGVCLVGGAILLVVGLRAALIVMVAVPMSFLIGISFVYLTGYGVHQMTITGLIIALGLLVDNAIVAVESVDRFRTMGVKGKTAVVKGISAIAWPMASSTLTTILAFVPIILLPDVTGDFLRSMPVTVIYTLAASLFVALTLIPLLSSRFLAHREGKNSRQTYLEKWVRTRYRPLLGWCLRHRWATLGMALVVFVGSLNLFPYIGVSFFPKAEKPQFLVGIELPRGTRIGATEREARYIEGVLLNQPETVACMTNVGKGNPYVYYNMPTRKNKPHFAQILVMVDETKGREVGQMVRDLRDRFADYPTGRVRIQEFEQGPGVEAPVEIRILGDHVETLGRIAGDVERMISTTPGAIYVENPFRKSGTDLAVRIHRDKAQLLGLSPADIDRAIRAAFAGIPASTYRDSKGKHYAMVVRLQIDGEPSMADFDRIYVTSRSGAHIPLKQVAHIEFKAAQTEISHYNLERSATLTSMVVGRSVDEVTREIIQKLDSYDWPPRYRYAVGGELESQEESFGGLEQALLLALVCIYGVLVLQFRSFLQPLIIFSAIPMAITGSFIALFITGYSFSTTAFLGLTSLVGIVVNDAILLVDHINLRRREGVDLLAAIEEAGVTRFIPVVLTSLTTIGGLLPLTLQGGTMWAPMGWAIIGGLLVATALTLLVVPILYRVFYSKAG